MLLSTVASFGDAGHGNADNKATTDNAAGQAWRFITQKPPRSGFVQAHQMGVPLAVVFGSSPPLFLYVSPPM
jgi:hypothetical protein